MEENLVSSIEWIKKSGKWFCSLIMFKEVLKRVILAPNSQISFKVLSGKYCVGYSSVSLNDSMLDMSKVRRVQNSCPARAEIENGIKCVSCSQKDSVHPCLICDGAKCYSSSLSVRESCEKAEAYVYIATFGLAKAKVGVAYHSRFPVRWIEQGANLAKKIIKGNGLEVRRLEHKIHREIDVLPGLRTERKKDTLWKKTEKNEFNILSETEKRIKERFPQTSFCKDVLHDLAPIYSLPLFDRKPITIKIREEMNLSGTILGTKGKLLFLRIKNLPYVLNLKTLIGRRLQFATTGNMILQTVLDKYLMPKSNT